MDSLQPPARLKLSFVLGGDHDIVICDTLTEVFEKSRTLFRLRPIAHPDFLDDLLQEIPHETGMTLAVMDNGKEQGVDISRAYAAMMSAHDRLLLEHDLCLPGAAPPRLLPGGKPGHRARK